MKALTLLLAVLFSSIANVVHAADARCYELLVYYAAPGKLDALNARFRDHTMQLFEKHGMASIGYWMPVENPNNELIFILAHPSRIAADKAWTEFSEDPELQRVQKESEAGGKLVAKYDQYFMVATDYSPEIKPLKTGAERLFELRTYTATPGHLDNLNARFRDHTLKIFEKHGMSSIAYWNLTPNEKDSDKTLIYLLAHASKEAAGASWKAFGADPDWVAARKDSEEKAGGPLTVKNGVKSVFMKATDYSPTK